jgi:hypothetical protein
MCELPKSVPSVVVGEPNLKAYDNLLRFTARSELN